MKLLFLAVALLGLAAVASTYEVRRDPCAWGPTYWCKSKTNAQQCRQVHYCRQNFWKSPLKKSVSVKQSACDLCKLVAGYVDQYLKNDATEQEAEAAVKELCALLPGNNSAQCDSLVDDYFDIIWQLLVNELDPDTICSALGLCTNSTVAINGAATTKTASLKSPLKKSVSAKQSACDLCKLVAGYVDQYLKNDATEQEAEAAVKELCALLPGNNSAQCDALVDDYFDIIWQLLVNELDPDTICSALGLCTNSTVAINGAATTKTASLKSPLKKSVSAKQSACDLCKVIAGFLEQFVDSNSTEQEVENAVKALCDRLPNSDQCDALVNQYFDLIWQLLENELKPDTICSALGLCNGSAVAVNGAATTKTAFLKSPLKKRVSVRDATCDLCKVVAGFVEQFVDSSTTEAEAKNETEKLCDFLGDYSKECHTMVDAYFGQVWQMLVNELKPDAICSQLGLCNNSAVAINGAAMTKTASLKGEKECEDCTKVVNVIEAAMNSSLTEAAAKELVKQVCDVLGPAAPGCKLIVGMFFDDIWKMLRKELTPQEICEQLKLCSRNASRTFIALPKAHLGVECSLCKYFMGKIVKDFVNTSNAQKKITSLIDEACDHLPTDKDQQECRTFIGDFFPTIWKLFINDLMTPDNICNLLGACGNETKFTARRRYPSLLRRISAKGGDERCDLCKEVDTELKGIVDQANQTQIKAELKALCNDLPGDTATECTDVVDNYFDLIWSLVKNYLDDPEGFCEIIGFCNSTARLLTTKTALTSEVECELCQFLVKEVDKVLTRNTTETEVLGVLEEGCKVLPSSYADTCTKFVEVYGPSLYRLLVSDAGSPDTVCSVIKVCTTSASKSSGVACELCEEGLSVVKALLPEATDTVVALLTKFCGLMPSAIQGECTDFVKEYGPDLIPLIANLINPDKDCQMIDLCSKTGVLKFRRRSL